jgi:transposase
MGKKAIIPIKESVEELESLYRKTRGYKSRQRIRSLLLTKQNKFATRLDLSIYLGIGLRTLFDWTNKYLSEGLTAMLSSRSGGARNSVITKELKISLEAKLNNSSNPLQGYNDAVSWVKENHNIDINYYTLRSFMIVNFGTKLKTPRKSHYKKDEVAFETFKKTSRIT